MIHSYYNQISREIINLIKDKADLVEMIMEDTPLTLQGSEYVGHHQKHESESKTSLHVHPEKALYYCFNCKEGGDPITWLMKNRGMTFQESVQYLSERTGIPLPAMSEEERKRIEQLYRDREEIEPVLMEATEFYHGQLKEEHIGDMRDRWGLTEETISRYKIGYAPPDGKSLCTQLLSLGYKKEVLLKTGLFYLNDDGTLTDIFRGRIMIPYFWNHKAVYLIGRWFNGCPDDKKASKYKKQPMHSKDKPYISPVISNRHFYGEDFAYSDELLITEGVADCIAALQAGFNCISPATVQFSEKDHSKLLKLCERKKKVFIVNDNEESGAGEKGALKTAESLERNDVNVFIVTLPRPEGVSKSDLAEYLRDNSPEKLRELLNNSKSLWEIKAENLTVPSNRVEALKCVNQFVADELKTCEPLVAGEIIKGILKDRFGLDKAEVNSLEKSHKKSVKELDDAEGEDTETKKQAAQLVEFAADGQLFHDPFKVPFALEEINDHSEIWPISSEEFRRWLLSRYYKKHNDVPSEDSIKRAGSLLEAKALYDGKEVKLSLRVAEYNGAFCYDLADDKWRTVMITKDGWTILDDNPVLFRRFKNTASQVEPNRENNDVNSLLSFINLKEDNQKNLLLVYVISCFVPGIPHPIPVFHGEKGSAKSTAMRVLRKLIDPANLELTTLPSSKDELGLKLSRNYFPAFDNLGHLNDWQSDMLCCAATGGGIGKRKLFTDDDEVFLPFKHCPALNGINCVATKPDLLDRAILFELERIDPKNRREESKFWEDFEKARPFILGGMFDILAKAMEIYPNVQLKELPRMADYCQWGYAIAEAMGIGGDTFLEAYNKNLGQANEEAIAGNLVATAITALMANIGNWAGTASELLKELDNICENEGINRNSKGWPKNPNSLSRKLNQVRSNLLDVGITYDRCKDSNRQRTRKINIHNAQIKPSDPSGTSKIKNDVASNSDDNRTIPSDHDDLPSEYCPDDDIQESPELLDYPDNMDESDGSDS